MVHGGLAINIDKTKLIKFGVNRNKRLIWEEQFSLDWANTFIALGIFYDIENTDKISEAKCVILTFVQLYQPEHSPPILK